MEKKLYKSMTTEEQLAWVTDFSSFNREKLPILCALGDAWESCHIKMFEEGLALVQAFSYCRDFVDRSMMFRDYSRRVERMKFYIEKIKKEISAGMVVRGTNGERIAYVPSLQPVSRRRGRPTKAEAAMAASQSQDDHYMMEKARVIADLTGSIIVTRPAQAVSSSVTRSGEKSGENVPSPLPVLQAVAQSQGPERLHLDQLAFLFPEELAASTREIQSLRAMAAKESEQAKALADSGATAEVIAPHSRAASSYVERYTEIYNSVDNHLASLGICMEMSLDHPLLSSALREGYTREALSSILRPYVEKMSARDGWAEKKKAELMAERSVGTETENARQEQKERAEKLHRYRVYMLRKDVNMTPQRVEKMRRIVEEVEQMGEDASEYHVILNAAEEYLSSLPESDPDNAVDEEE